MTVEIFNETFVGLSELKFQRISDGVVLNLPTPSSFVVAENKTQKIQTTKSAQGRMVRASTYITAEMPVLTVDYTFMQPEIIAFRLGNQFQQGTYPVSTARTIEVIQGSFGAAALNYIGNGMPADEPGTEASTRPIGGLSTLLARQPFATFDPTIVHSFAQGADGALKFSNDLVASREIVSVIMPLQVTGIALGDQLVGAHRVVASLVNTQNYVWIFTADNVTINVEGSTFDPQAENMQLPFFINNPPGACRGWNLYFTNQKVKCAY